MAKKKRRSAQKMKEPVRRDTSDRIRKRKKRPTARKSRPVNAAVQAAPRKRRNTKRRGLGAGQIDLIYKLLLAASLVAAVAFVCVTFFRVKTIMVTGNQVCTADQIAQASGVEMEDRLLFINRFEMSKGILEQLPYVDEVKIRKRFPSTLHIEVREAEPAAAIISGNMYYLIDKNAKLLEYRPYDEDNQIEGLHLDGLEIAEQAPGKTIELIDELRLTTLNTVLGTFLDHPILEKIGAVHMDKLYSITFTYNDRIVVNLGDTERLAEKLDMLEAVMEGFDGTERGHLDVSEVTQARFLPDNNAVSGETP